MKKPLFLLCALALTMTAHASGDKAAGEAVWKRVNCASCHGADAKSPIDPTYPKLAGQHYTYLVAALRQYQRGMAPASSGIAPVRKTPVMGAMSTQLSGKEIQDVAAYLASLTGDLSVHK